MSPEGREKFDPDKKPSAQVANDDAKTDDGFLRSAVHVPHEVSTYPMMVAC